MEFFFFVFQIAWQGLYVRSLLEVSLGWARGLKYFPFLMGLSWDSQEATQTTRESSKTAAVSTERSLKCRLEEAYRVQSFDTTSYAGRRCQSWCLSGFNRLSSSHVMTCLDALRKRRNRIKRGQAGQRNTLISFSLPLMCGHRRLRGIFPRWGRGLYVWTVVGV